MEIHNDSYANYTAADRDRMRYYLKEMKDKFARHPESLSLRNGIAAIEERLRLPKTVEAIDSLAWINDRIEEKMQQVRFD